MQKLWLIIEREYVTRIRRRSFILATLLTPLAFGLFITVINFIFRYESDEALRIAVVDPDGIFGPAMADERQVYFKLVDLPLDSLRRLAAQENSPYDGILVAPRAGNPLQQQYESCYYSDSKLTLDLEPILLARLQGALRRHKIKQLNLREEELTALDTRVSISARPLAATAEAGQGSHLTGKIAAVIGIIMGLGMYTTVFVYGMMVMRGVMEEKTNRIVEVMVSSVRPFPLMMGKIIGIGGVGLTQVAVWAVMIPAILLVVNLLFGIDPRAGALAMEAPAMEVAEAEVLFGQIVYEVYQLRWGLILPLFMLYFLGGYFMYAALFAAVGSAMNDDLGEGQSLTIPITIPVVLASYIMLAAIQSPHSTLAVGASLFPLFSPIVMPARLPFDPRWWEVTLSLVLLAGTALLLIWLSGRIYRTGILLYGKKVTLADLARWMFKP